MDTKIKAFNKSSTWMFPKIGGKPPKWMVYFMENPIKMDDLGVPLFLETPTLRKILQFEFDILLKSNMVFLFFFGGGGGFGPFM